MKYKVTVRRLAVQELVLDVEADSEQKAEEKALSEAPNHDFGGTEKEADYTVELITKENGEDTWISR
jgi:hypothetical protein